MSQITRALSADVRTRFYIAGAWKETRSRERAVVIHPATQEALLEVPLAHAEDVQRAIRAARTAFDDGPWRGSSGAQRSALLTRFAHALSNRAPLMAQLWTAQVGAPISLSTRLVNEGLRRLQYYAQLAASHVFESARPTTRGSARVRREPAGVAVLVVPWNATFPILCHKLGAALAAGCCCIVKSSPASPLDALVVAECAHEAGFPPGVLNVINAELGESARLVASPEVDTISFSGSLATGRAIARACAPNMTRLMLQLGGKSAAILLEDVDLAQALDALMPFTMPFSGQTCFANSRILVPRALLDRAVALLVPRLSRMIIGDPWQPETEVGPVLNRRQANRILAFIEAGRREGAELITGGQRSPRFPRGYYIEPTLFACCAPDISLAREEIFGPVITLEPFESVDEAVRMANAPGLGLSGSVYARDPERAYAVACRIRAGQVGVNGLELCPSVPFGGYKLSGLGREGGPEGLEGFLESKAIFMPPSGAGASDDTSLA